MDETPAIACTLSADELDRRSGELETLAGGALIALERADRVVSMRFRPDAHARGRVASFVAAESRCCEFLAFELTSRPDALLLTITAPPGGEPILGQLAERLRPV